MRGIHARHYMRGITCDALHARLQSAHCQRIRLDTLPERDIRSRHRIAWSTCEMQLTERTTVGVNS